ncbi:MAG: hypothetical protein MJ247_03245 [Alphaproteobacteria bacterium]|nr:hypothetical protein [Alphaproteobacteria bacterium]
MSDNLSWTKRHFVLLRYLELKDVIEKEQYKKRPDLQEFYENRKSVEDIIWHFADKSRYKCACDLLAYSSNRRAVIWWLYLCVLSLFEEFKIKPNMDRDIEDIAKSFKPVVPDFAKIEPPKPTDGQIQELENDLAEIKSAVASVRELVNPEVMAEVDEAMDYANQLFKDKYGSFPLDLIKKQLENQKDPMPIDPESPIYKAADELEQKLQAVRKKTIDTIKSVIPPTIPEHDKKIMDDALRAVYKWVISPDEINSKICLDAGNECPDKPAGLLALSAFWAGGNLMPGSQQVVPTPPGLAANGACQVLLMCSLAKGGIRDVKERFKLYFEIGVDVMIGKNVWDDIVEVNQKKSAVYDKIHVDKEKLEKNTNNENIMPSENVSNLKYSRWKPDIK